MSKKTRKYFVDTKLAMELFEAYGFESREINNYCIRVRDVERKIFFDWYHTRGTVVLNKKGVNLKTYQEFGDAEDLALYIKRFIENENK